MPAVDHGSGLSTLSRQDRDSAVTKGNWQRLMIIPAINIEAVFQALPIMTKVGLHSIVTRRLITGNLTADAAAVLRRSSERNSN